MTPDEKTISAREETLRRLLIQSRETAKQAAFAALFLIFLVIAMVVILGEP